MDGFTSYWRAKLDQSAIVYNVEDGKVYGGSDPGRTVKQVQRDSDGYYPGGDVIMELDLLNRSLVMEVYNQKVTIDGNIGDFEYSPIVIMYGSAGIAAPEVTILRSGKECSIM